MDIIHSRVPLFITGGGFLWWGGIKAKVLSHVKYGNIIVRATRVPHTIDGACHSRVLCGTSDGNISHVRQIDQIDHDLLQ